MSFEDDEYVKKHFDSNPKIFNNYANNKKKVDENWEKIKNHKDLDNLLVRSQLKLLDKFVKVNYVKELIIERGKKQLRNWKILKYLSFFSAIIFLIVLYVVFWYMTSDFKMIQESFSNLFCVT